MKRSLVLSSAILAAASFSFAPTLSAESAQNQARDAQNEAQQAARQAEQSGQSAAQDAREAGSKAIGEQTGRQQDPQKEQKDFVKDSASDNQYEIQAGQFVQQHARDQQVKQFAQKLVQDHQQAQQQLKQIAQGMQVEVSDQLMPVQQAKLQELQKKHGAELERAFIFDQVGDHQKDILCNQYESEHAQSQQIKQFAQQQIPTLQEHLQMAMQAAEQWVPQARQAGERMQGRHHQGQTGGSEQSGTSTPGAASEQGGAGASSGQVGTQSHTNGQSSGAAGRVGDTAGGSSAGGTSGTAGGTSGGATR